MKYDVSRQAVSKALKSSNMDFMADLLGLARSIGGLVEWVNEKSGLLVGIVPQLENRRFLVLINESLLPKVYYEQSNHLLPDEIRKSIKLALHLTLVSTDFDAVVKLLVSKVKEYGL